MIEFKKASIEDAQEIVTLVNSAYRGESSQKGWTTEAHLLGGQRTDIAMIIEMICDPLSWIELALLNGKIEGCVNLKLKDHYLYLGMLTVNPEIQNQGIGKKLLDKVEELAHIQGLSEIRMSILKNRPELEAYYHRRGYTYTGAKEPFPENDPRYGLPMEKGYELFELSKKLK